LTNLQQAVNDGEFMYPLFAAVETTRSKSHSDWYTFTPHEVGCDQLGLFIPTWSFNRKFSNGSSTDFSPEQRLGFFMALWGSALSGSVKQMYSATAGEQITNQVINDFIKKIIKETVGGLEIAPVEINNPWYGFKDNPTKNVDKLRFIDAGYMCNLPALPLLHPQRAVDIIIMLDVSEKVHTGKGSPDLHKLQSLVQSRGLPFPNIDFNNINKKAITVIADDKNTNAPIIIYLPAVKNEKHPEWGDLASEVLTTFASANFTYSKKDYERLIKIVRANVVDNKDKIIEAIKQKVAQKKAIKR
jgi:cytosolic phospholipase A2